MRRNLAVLEAEWFPGYTHSVKPFFEGMLQCVDPDALSNAFYYERFVGAASLEEALQFVTQKRDARFLYLATHGTDRSLGCPNGDEVSRRRFDRIMKGANEGTRLDGLLLGSCLIGNKDTARTLLKSDIAPAQRLKWVAGYEEKVDWLESTLLDVFFLKHVLEATSAHQLTPARAVSHACNEILYKLEGLQKHMRFRVYARQKKTGDVVDLLALMERDRENFIAEQHIDSN